MKKIKTVIGYWAIGLALAPVVEAQTSLSLSPVQFDFKMAAGRSGKGMVIIGNDSFNTVRIRAGVVNWTIGTVGSDVFPAPGAEMFSCRDWIQVNNPEFLLKPEAQQTVSAVVSVPSTAENGQYLAAVSFKSESGAAAADRFGVSIQGQLIAVVFVTVGDPKAEGTVADLAFEKKEGRNALVLRVKNSGRTFLETSGGIELRDARGKKVYDEDMPEELVPPLSERLLTVMPEKELAPGPYQAECVFRIPSHKAVKIKKDLIIE